jgi:glycosyltransferase involved in cell wall biosynthesis
MISGFTYIHNAIEGGYPIRESVNAVRPFVDEIVVVDCQSTDGTSEILKNLNVRIIKGNWGTRAGETLKHAHAMNIQCCNEIIIHFEADEVYHEKLILNIINEIKAGNYELSVHRLQLEQNFQRCRWYPTPCHRIFKRGTATKDGESTKQHKQYNQTKILSPEFGYLYDITNCFRDSWFSRINNQQKLRNDSGNYLMCMKHIANSPNITKEQTQELIASDHWLWKTSPFDIPAILKPLVGKTKYS